MNKQPEEGKSTIKCTCNEFTEIYDCKKDCDAEPPIKRQSSVNILEGNRIIHIWMGKSYETDRKIMILKYHSSWDWIMPAIEKISKIPLLNADNTLCTDHDDTCFPITFNMPTEDGKVMFRFKGFALHTADKLIDAAWQAVVEVLEYEINNTQTKKQ